MRRIWPAIVIAVLFAPVVYRLCWGETSESPTGKREITYMAWGYPSQLGTERRLIEKFHEENPDIHVRFIMAPMSSYYDKVGIMFASGTAPDIVRVNPQHFAAYVRMGYLKDLEPLMEADAGYNPEDFFPAARDAGLYNGRHYGLGVLFTRGLVYYNKTAFKEAGVEEPWDAYRAGRWHWGDLVETARRLTIRDEETGRPLQYGINFIGRIYNVFDVAMSNGGRILSEDGTEAYLDSPEVLDAVNRILDLRRKWHVAPTPEQGAMALFSFESGRLAMEIDSSGESPRLRDAITDFEWDVAPTPYGSEGAGSSHGAHLLVMNAATKEAAAAWRFMTFVTGPTAERLLGVEERRCIPTRREIAFSEEYLSADEPPFNMRAFVADIDMPVRQVPVTEKWNEWTSEFQAYLDQIWLGGRPPQEALREADARIDRILRDS